MNQQEKLKQIMIAKCKQKAEEQKKANKGKKADKPATKNNIFKR